MKLGQLFPSSLADTAPGAKGALTCVGVMWLMSSDASCFSRVVLPALSKPRRRIRTSWSGALFNLRKIESKPLDNHERDGLPGGSDFGVSRHQNDFLNKVLGHGEPITAHSKAICFTCSFLPSLSRSVGKCSNLVSSMLIPAPPPTSPA